MSNATTESDGFARMTPADLARPWFQGMFAVPLKCTCLSGTSSVLLAEYSTGGPTVAGRLRLHGQPAAPPAQSCGRPHRLSIHSALSFGEHVYHSAIASSQALTANSLS
mmetsp:Transcript_59245/g.132921  ORF Transcript_59245/g.132921 Transcript_59245/m.132921 type:complete len:109 (+) Transcript_59245:586-912(+)